MEKELQKLSIKNSTALPKQRLGTNVYPFSVDNSVVVSKYIVSVERRVTTSNGISKTVPIKSIGADAIRLIRCAIFKQALAVISRMREHKEKTIVYDGFDTVYSNAVISENVLSKEITVSQLILSDEEKRIVLRESTIVCVKMKPDGGFRNLNSRIQDCDREDSSLVHFFSNLVKSAAPNTQFIALRGGRLIDKTTLREIGSGMERAQGIKLGTKMIGSEVLSFAVDIDSREGTFFKPQRVLKSIVDYFKSSENEVRREFDNPYSVRKIERFIRDLTVRVEGSDKIVCIVGIKWERDDEGRQREASRDQSGMLLAVEENLNGEGSITRNYHPLDKLHILPHTRVPMAKQDKVRKPPALDPDVRYKKINEARKDIKIDVQNDNLKGFRTSIANVPVCPTYEIIPPPTISVMENGRMRPVTIDQTKHEYNSNPFQFVEPARINRFYVVFDNREVHKEDEARRLFDGLRTVCNAKGLTADKAAFFGMNLNELEIKLEHLNSEREKVVKNGEVPTVLVMCIGFKDDHDKLKYLEYKYKVLTQQVMRFTMQEVLKKNGFERDMRLHGIVKKINEKCGGSNMEVTGPTECENLFPKRTGNGPASLIVGMDVCHGEILSKHLERRGIMPDPSIIGISSNSQTSNPQKYVGEFIATQGRREAVPSAVMTDNGRFFVNQFLKNHGRLPDNVILVRDGVSRSQYDMARGEFSALMEGARSAANSNEFKPREVLIIVTKEHDMRLFDRKNGKVCNPCPGTVVDTEIVSPFYPEFLIIPHDAFKGTAKPLLVTILQDGEKKLRDYPSESLNEIKHFIHSLCYLHARVDKPPGLPEPVSVGHDLAERGSNLCKEHRFQNGPQTVEQLNRWLRTRDTLFEGVKFTA